MSSLTIDERKYTHPEVLATTDWVAAHLADPDVRLIESNEDTLLYSSGHVPGAAHVDWTTDLNDQIRRDYITRDGFERLMSAIGITSRTTLVFYGDKNNWWACYAFWVFQLFGHTRAKVMDGGRLKWEQEQRPFTRERPAFPKVRSSAPDRNDRIDRTFRDEVLAHARAHGQMVDVRSPQEFTGERLHMPDYPNEGSLRGGHIPGARSIPWSRAINPADGTFKSAADLRALYVEEQGLDSSQDVVVYCRIGERSSHTWFVLKYLLGFPRVRNYDGSWTEWGNMVGVPIEKP
jgi:thiosulfate/3-mercaptopyruvate sulfurtransferase